MFHFFSSNQKQKKKNIFYISSIFVEMRIDVKILHDEIKSTCSSCKFRRKIIQVFLDFVLSFT